MESAGDDGGSARVRLGPRGTITQCRCALRRSSRADRVVRRIFTATTTSCRCSPSTTAAPNPARSGALLRREGLYSSLVTDWRRQHRQGPLEADRAVAHPTAAAASRSASEVARLRAENERLKIKLAQAEAVIDVQGKVHALLEELSKSAATDESSPTSSTPRSTNSSTAVSRDAACEALGRSRATPLPATPSPHPCTGRRRHARRRLGR